MNEYEQGQMDLIKDIKEQIRDIESKSRNEDLLFDIIMLLKSLKPVKKP